MASTYLTRTPSSSGNRKTWTFSAWVKRSDPSGVNMIFQQGSDTSNRFGVNFQGGNLRWRSIAGGSNTAYLATNRVFRDTSAWYHIVVRFDSTNATAGDRMRLYINGVEETSFSTDINPSLNYEGLVNTTNPIDIGRNNTSNDSFFDGEMSHIHFIDGTAYDASAFGETDATTGEWKIKTSPSVTYGTNGFFILKDGNSVTDQSGNSNNFTVGGGTLTKTEDNPSNVFATLNPLDGYWSGYTYAQGNTAVASTSASRTYVTSTLGMTSGKYYWECLLDATIGDSGGASTSVYVGITGQSPISGSQFPSDGTCFNCVMNTNGQVYSNGSTIGSAMGSAWATSTFVMMAYDADNNKMYFGKDGVWLNSGDPTSGATGTGAFTPTTAASATPIGVYMPQWGVDFNASYGTSFNFGNGYFGTTAVASAGINLSGNGIFEYDVPTGYTALSTKGLNL